MKNEIIYDNSWVNIYMIENALYYCQNLINETVGMDLSDPYHIDELFKKNCFLPEYRVKNEVIEQI
jgi:hypothetical protein